MKFSFKNSKKKQKIIEVQKSHHSKNKQFTFLTNFYLRSGQDSDFAKRMKMSTLKIGRFFEKSVHGAVHGQNPRQQKSL